MSFLCSTLPAWKLRKASGSEKSFIRNGNKDICVLQLHFPWHQHFKIIWKILQEIILLPPKIMSETGTVGRGEIGHLYRIFSLQEQVIPYIAQHSLAIGHWFPISNPMNCVTRVISCWWKGLFNKLTKMCGWFSVSRILTDRIICLLWINLASPIIFNKKALQISKLAINKNRRANTKQQQQERNELDIKQNSLWERATSTYR